jgi:hypothetical protein
MMRLADSQHSQPTAVESTPGRGGRKRITRLHGAVIALVLLMSLLTTPGPAGASVHFAVTQPISGSPFNPNNPCLPVFQSGVGFNISTPFGSFPAYYCKHSKITNGVLWAPSNFSLWVDATSVGGGIQTATGSVVCLNVIGHTAYERDLIVTATGTPVLFPAGNGLFVRLVDNNFPIEPVWPTAPLDQIGAFLTPPPDSLPCPAVPVTTSPDTFGGVIVF